MGGFRKFFLLTFSLWASVLHAETLIPKVTGWVNVNEIKESGNNVIRLLAEPRSSQFVITLADGGVWDEGRIVTQEGRALSDTRVISTDRFRPGQSFSPEETKYFDGTLAVISSPGSENWYHWLLQILPRLKILSEAGVSYDRIYICAEGMSWQRNSLDAVLNELKIPKNKILWARDGELWIAKNLIVPSLPVKGGSEIPHWLKRFLRTTFLGRNESNFATAKKIYISRSKAKVRKIINEKELMEFLTPLGFQKIFLEDLSPYEQANIFNKARVIVGVHGSGLSNLVFTEAGARIIELDQSESPGGLFAGMSKQFGCNHSLVLLNRQNLEGDLKVGVTSLREFLQID